MDILDESFGATPESVQLDDLIETRPLTTSVPTASIRNRAALDALLSSEPQDLVEKYRLLMKEGEEGSDVSHEDVLRKLEEQNKNKSMKHILNILGDKNIPLEQKQQVFDLVQRNGFREDPAITLRTNALVAPSAGESLRGEAARISTAEMMQEIHRDAEQRQKMVNSVVMSHPEVGVRTVGELAEAEVMPFGRNMIMANVNEAIKKAGGEDTGFFSWFKDFLTPGTTRKEIREKLSRVPLDRRDEFAATVLEGIKNSKAVFFNENYYAQFKNAESLLLSPADKTEDAWMENLLTLFDVFWIADGVKRVGRMGKAAEQTTAQATSGSANARRPGSAKEGVEDVEFDEVHRADWELVGDPTNPMQIGKPKDRIGMDKPKLLEGPKKQEDALKRVQLNSVVKQENPVSPFAIIEQSNPEQARNIHQAVMASKTDELAEAVAGVSREQFAANNLLPQIGTDTGNVLYKVNQAIVEGVQNTGATRFTPEELAQAQGRVQSIVRSVPGLEINDAMTVVRLDGDRLIVEGHYSAPGGSFNTAAEAKAHAKFYLKELGVLDEEVKIMKREGLDYVPITGDEVGEGDFIIKVMTNHEIQPDDISTWSNLDVKRNFFDRIGFTVTDGGGSISRWLFDAASMLHPVLTRSTSVAVDQSIAFENILLKPIKELRSEIEAMDKVRRSKVEEYMKEANLNQIKFDPVNLYAQGFNQKEIEALKKWKDIQDGHYYLENLDLVRTLRNQGYQIFENSNFRGFAKPVPKNRNINKVYDPEVDRVVLLTDSAIDDLYNTDGTMAKLRRPTTVNGDSFEYIVIRNTPTSYLRGLRETDKVLNYRDGYFTIYYKAPKFVEEKFIDPTTRQERWRAVAVAGSTEEADIYRANAQAQTGGEYRVRGDVRAVRHDDDAYWDLNSSMGRIAQRHRGDTLADASGLQHLGRGSYMAHPMESAVRAAKSLAERTMMRNVIDTAKRRAVTQYGEMFPPDGMGGSRFPNSLGEVSDKGNPFGKGFGDAPVADARTTVEFIRYIENGYVNSTDEIYKASMNILAEWLGSKHFTIAEKATRAVGSVGVTHALKTSVFQAYIALNPLRQIVLQPHQSIRMLAFNPKGYHKAFQLSANYLLFKGGALNVITKEEWAFFKFIENSGALAGVDQHSLVRGMKLDLASSASKPKRILGAVASAPQTVGFNAGEKINQLVHLANVYEKRIREGHDLADKTLRDRAYSEARALSYEMNFAGDMPYNQTALAAQFQFLQVPHKAWLQLTNRKLDNKDISRVAVFDFIMWGSPLAPIAAWLGKDLLPDSDTLREAVVDGIEAIGLNSFFSQIFGEESKVDYGSLSPYDMSGWVRLWDTFMDDGALATILASPAGQLWAKDGGRIPNAVTAMARWLGAVEDYQEDKYTFLSAVKEAAKISSGWNNAQKAKVLLSTRKKFDSMGRITDSDVSTPEALHALFGFGTESEAKLYEISKQLTKTSKKHREETMSRYQDIMRWTAQAMETDNADINFILSVHNKLMMAFEDDPVALQMIRKQWMEDAKGKERELVEKFFKLTNIPNPGNLKDKIRMSPMDEHTKELMLQRIDDVASLRNKNKE